MASEVLTVEQYGVTLDLLIFRRFRREVRLQVETVLASTFNLAEKGLFLPLGTQVEVEIADVQANTTPVVRVKRLWG